MPEVPHYLRHATPGSGGSNDLFGADAPLGGGRVQLVLAGNTRYLGRENAKRHLRSHIGWVNITAASPSGQTSDPVGPQDIDWVTPPKRGGAATCLGTFWAVSWADMPASVYPTVTLTARGKVGTAGNILGVLLGVAPYIQQNTDRARSLYMRSVGTHYTGTVVGNITGGGGISTPVNGLSIQLTERDLAAVDYAPPYARGEPAGGRPLETAQLKMFSVYVGCYVAGSGSPTATLTGLSLFLEGLS